MAEDKGPTAAGGPTNSRSQREEKVLQFWQEHKVFEKTLTKEAPLGDFVFYEGPPGSNGRPGIHHMESRFFKDAIPRYKTMRGYRVPRQAGWDTHGLPVELEAEKVLGIKHKNEIEALGIEKFNAECRKIVWKYVDEWEKLSDRIGFWLDFKNAYVTYHNPYIESVWGVIKHVEDRGLLYKDYKVLPWCPRCGTALSSHELAQGYQDVKDLSLYVKFKVKNPEKLGLSGNVFLLAWTTTPWTLPGNVALAVGNDIEYQLTQNLDNSEIYIIAKARNGLSFYKMMNEKAAILDKEFLGKDLAGLIYEPLYPFVEDLAAGAEREKLANAYKVYTADFVTTEDGTGIVHTAVMYGQDDFELGTKVGLPKVHLVNPEGEFVKGTGWLEGRSVVDPELAVDILKDLQKNGHFFAKENHLHSYPFCWRCKTRLIYYARDSWYIRMSELRQELMAENERINWEPDYIKEGRFGEWLREVKDWALSRERYWGTPLPVWENADKSKRLVVDSVATLKEHAKRSGNSYFVMRHGGTEANAHERVSYAKEAEDHLTDAGRAQASAAAKDLESKDIDLIIASPFARTKETAEIVRETLGLPEEALIFDERLKEVNPGEFDGKNWHDYHEYMYRVGPDWFTRTIPGGEALKDVAKRVGAALYDLEQTYKDKKILIVTHGGPAWLAYVVSGEYQPDHKEYKPADTHVFIKEFRRFDNAEVRELPFVPLPHDESYCVDLHRPFIDDVVLEKDSEEYRRVKEVMDVWLDSGAMPFATNAPYPADFIAEGLDQTRGWFYTLHAVGVLMEKGRAFKNVICLGLILDKDGKKMSKSVGNVVDPWAEIEKYGVDVLRLWMYSINQPGENKNFDERSVEEVNKRVFNLLDNVYSFYELYEDPKTDRTNETNRSDNALDRWILARLSELTAEVTERLEVYQLLEPVRALRDFIDDLSTWYLRRSRSALKEGDKEAKQTLYFVLKTLARLMAPFAPFAAEELYQKLKTERDPLSVHLAAWPEAGDFDAELIAEMRSVRKLASLGLEARSRANIKIRQPLAELKIKTVMADELLDILRDELNVKKVTVDESLAEEVQLDTALTPELEEEGRVRELIRSIQELRKERELKPGELMEYEVESKDQALFAKYQEEICRTTSIRPKA